MAEKKNPKLHEVLAVEKAKEKVALEALKEGKDTFTKRADHFQAHLKTYEPYVDEEENKIPEERKSLVTTVPDKLEFVFSHVNSYLDVVFQKEAANQEAKADVVLEDGTVLLENAPVSFLLNLESKIKLWREVLSNIPTLQPGVSWLPDPSVGENVFRTEFPKESLRTTQQFKSQILVKPTDKHPAQIEKWTEQVPVGKYVQTTWSSMLSPADKSKILGRLDDLAQASKRARMRANMTEVNPVKIGKKLTSFVLKGI